MTVDALMINNDGDTMIADTDVTYAERAALAEDAKALNLTQFWEQRLDIELLAPRATAEPFRWKWTDIEPRLRIASRTVPIEECERRALVFANPGLGGRPFITNTLFAAYSLYNPGEKAPVHRHTPCASRFVLDGDGGYTVVEGEKLQMARGDLVITPNGTWHDHGNDGKDAIIWVDVLDVPMVEAFNATVFEFDYLDVDGEKATYQAHKHAVGYSTAMYSTGGIKPLNVDHQRGLNRHSPMFIYRWADTQKALRAIREHTIDLHDGVMVEYVDPTDGASVMQTMAFRCQMLDAGMITLPQRRMSSAMYVVLEGEGKTEINGATLEWKRNDVFAIPSWSWYRHCAGTSGEAILYSVSDEVAARKLGYYQREIRDEAGDVMRTS